MQKKKLALSNKLRSNEIIQSAMHKRRALALSAIAKVCDINFEIKVVKNNINC